jgi:hypothetical protein
MIARFDANSIVAVALRSVGHRHELGRAEQARVGLLVVVGCALRLVLGAGFV